MQQIIETVFAKLPVVFLGAALILMFFVAVPVSNHDAVISVISGFLGLLTGRAMTTPTPTTTSTTVSTPDATQQVETQS